MAGDFLTRFAPYIGVPYKSGGRDPHGWEWWGVVFYLSRAYFGRQVPDYQGYEDAERREEATPIVQRESLLDWLQISTGYEDAGDVVVFHMLGTPLHCGIVLETPLMLHCLAGRGTTLESYDAPGWRKRIEGFYRWPMAV